MKKLFVSIVLLFSIASLLNASSCSDYEYDQAEALAEQFGNYFVANDMGGGDNIVVTLDTCEYNTYSKKYKLKIEINWDGAIFSSDHYEVDGILQIKPDATDIYFAKTWVNQEVKNLNFWKDLAAGVIILNNLAQQQDNQNNN